MSNKIINKITFTEDFWFDHEGPNPNAKKRVRTVQKHGGTGFGDDWKPYPKVKEEWRKLTLFKKNFEILFNAGLNVIVGENGSGKSTLLRLLTKHDMYSGVKIEASGEYRILDFETGNARYSIQPDPEGPNYVRDIASLWFVQEESHGETLSKQFRAVMDCDGICVMLDEPETALSIPNQYRYWDMLKEKAKTNQIIMITHCKTFIENADYVFDMTTHAWMSGHEYIKKCTTKKRDKSCKL